MKKPHTQQLECLRRIASSRFRGSPPCDMQILEQLLRDGLVERTPFVWMPVQLIRMTYRLTPRGERMLRGR